MFIKLATAALVSLACFHAHGAEFSVTRQYVVALIITTPLNKGEVDPSKIRAAGSGVLVAPGYVVTANHVLPKKGQEIHVEVAGGGLKKGTVVASDPAHELGLIKVDVPCPCAPLAKTELPLDADVITVGYPLWGIYGMQFLTVGHMQGANGIYNIVTANTISGGSGGGQFGKEEGVYKLAGITSSIALAGIGPQELAVRQDVTWLCNSISISEVKKFLDRNHVAYK